MDIRLKFGLRVKELRVERKLSQEALANLAGIDRTYIPGIEKGERNVSLVIAEKIANALELELHQLFIGL